jgi:diguanylate cyclase (GGDEF)-like protein
MRREVKLFITVFFLIVIIVLFSYVYIQQRIDGLKTQKYQEISQVMQNDWRLLIQEKSEAIRLVCLTLSQDKEVEEILRTKKYSKLHLKKLSRLIQKYTSLKNVWFQVINAKGISVYRSWTSKHGDNLSSVRLDVAQMLKNPRVMSTISVGKYDLSFKSLIPIYDKEQNFMGLIETLAKFNSLVLKLNAKGYETVILVDKHYKKQLTKSTTNLFIHNYYVADSRTAKELLNILKKEKIDYFLDIKDYKIDKNNNYLFTLLKVKGLDNRPMAFFIVAKPLNSIDMSAIVKMKDETIKRLFVFFSFLLLILYIIYTLNYKRFIQKQNALLACSVEDKTEELKKQNKEMEYLAHHDALTKLPNKNLFIERLEQIIDNRKDENQKLSVLLLDLDRFKEVNDTYGHDIGDLLLQQIAKRLSVCIGSDDMVARISGDEFAILLVDRDYTTIITVLEKIFEEIKKPFIILGIEIHTTFSIGISSYIQDGKTPDILLRNADTAMYKAKGDGKNSYQFYTQEMTASVRKRIELDSDIRNGLKNGEFVAYYQPKIDAKSLKIVGLEALIRWNHPTRGVLEPLDFIPFAQEVGLIVEIDKYMLEHAVKQLVKWRNEGYTTGKLSINLSTKKLESEGFCKELHKLIQESGVDTTYLELEILESQIMKDPERSINILHSIRDLGISISIDDFGTGYSSLSYLKKLPVSKLKIDRSFIIDVPKDEDDIAIIRTIIALANSLGLEIIAEGVESERQVDFLVQEGCNYIQGYYYSKALRKEDCEIFMKKHV